VNRIPLSSILTPREHKFYLGGSLGPDQPTDLKQWDTPVGVNRKELTARQASEERRRLDHAGSLSLQLFFGPDHRMGFTLPSLDESGMTVANPRMLELDPQTGDVIRELSLDDEAKYYDFYRSVTKDLPPDREIPNPRIDSEGNV
jgi:hypothetical protein